MPFVLHSDEKSRFYFGSETTFGTPKALSATDYKELVIQKGQFVDLGISKTNLNQNRASRVPTLVDQFHDNFSGPIGLQFESYCTLDRIADLLHLVTQNRVSVGGASAYQKLYRMHASQPDFTANAGAFVTMIWKSPETAKDIRLTSGILRELTISFDKQSVGESNLVKVSGLWIFKKYEIDQTFTGTAAAQDISLRFLCHTFLLSLSSLSIDPANFSRLSLTLRNNAVGVDRDISGNPFTYFLTPDITASMELWYTGSYVNAFRDASVGTPLAFVLAAGLNNVVGYFAISANGVITNTPIGTGGGQQRIPIELQLGNTTAAGTDGCDVTIADGVAP